MNPRWRAMLFLLTALLGFSTCAPKKASRRGYVEAAAQVKAEKVALACRLGRDFVADFFSRHACKSHLYSHVGVAVFEAGSAFVYHSEASELTGKGGVERQPLNDFLDESRRYRLFKLALSNDLKQKLVSVLRGMLRQKIPFDLDFDNETKDKLYCSEMVAVALDSVCPQCPIQPDGEGPSGRIYTIDDILRLPYVAPLAGPVENPMRQ